MKKRIFIITLIGVLILVVITLVIFQSVKNTKIDEPPEMIECDEQFDNLHPLFPDGIVDFGYCTKDGDYYIEYDEIDFFVAGSNIQLNSCVSKTDCLIIHCSETDFFECLEMYNNIIKREDEIQKIKDVNERNRIRKQEDKLHEANETFCIREELNIDSDGTPIFCYKLTRR